MPRDSRGAELLADRLSIEWPDMVIGDDERVLKISRVGAALGGICQKSLPDLNVVAAIELRTR